MYFMEFTLRKTVISFLTEIPEQILRGNFMNQVKQVLKKYSICDYLCAFV